MPGFHVWASSLESLAGSLVVWLAGCLVGGLPGLLAALTPAGETSQSGHDAVAALLTGSKPASKLVEREIHRADRLRACLIASSQPSFARFHRSQRQLKA